LPEPLVVDGRLTLGALETDCLAEILLRDAPPVHIPVGDDLTGSLEGIAASQRWTDDEVELTLRLERTEPVDVAVRFGFRLGPVSGPKWLIPGCFYGENRLPDNARRFPRWDPNGGDPADLVSDTWSFRSDRTTTAAICAWSDAAFAALAGDEVTALGMSGVGFRGDAWGSEIWLDAPYREEPVTYVDAETAGPPERRWYHWSPGEEIRLRYRVAVGPPDPHAYAPFLREEAGRRASVNELNPWMEPAEAAALAAEGLYRWHYHADERVLYETAAFDREAAAGLDRRAMHVAWVSGAPWAAALLEHGRRAGEGRYADAGAAVLDTIAGALAPSGTFYGEWRDGRWTGGWNPRPTWVHARTLAEATLFMTRALRAERERETDHPVWAAAIRSNLGFVAARQRKDGNLGSYYDFETAAVESWEGAAGVLWVAALVEASQLLAEPAWLGSAQRAAGYYADFVDAELIYGAPEDVLLTPTSEDGYNAVIAYVVLHRADGDPRWLDLARRAADWMLTFRYAYNVVFPPDTLLGRYDFRTRGGDMASPSNQHLHAYGLLCYPELLRFAELIGDVWYADRARENLACFRQFVARRDGDFDARIGMVSERYYQTNWGGPKGGLLTLSHAWSIGVLLYACLADTGRDYP
jgi:hypothetical protein